MRRLPLRWENSETRLSISMHILVLVYVKYCQRGQPLLTYSTSKRDFSPSMPLKLRSAAQVDTCLDHHRCDDWVLNSYILRIVSVFSYLIMKLLPGKMGNSISKALKIKLFWGSMPPHFLEAREFGDPHYALLCVPKRKNHATPLSGFGSGATHPHLKI